MSQPASGLVPSFPKAPLLGKAGHSTPGNVVTLRDRQRATPSTENGKVVPPRRVPNRERRAREHLTPQEVEALVTAAGRLGRHGHRDTTLILLAYRHALRVGELVVLRWDQQERHAVYASPKRAGDSRPPPPEARIEDLAVRVHDRTRRAAHDSDGA